MRWAVVNILDPHSYLDVHMTTDELLFRMHFQDTVSKYAASREKCNSGSIGSYDFLIWKPFLEKLRPLVGLLGRNETFRLGAVAIS